MALTIECLHKRFTFDLKTGAVFNKKTGNQLDVLHHFKGQSSSNIRYKQVQFSLDGKNVKIAAHRMIWAVVHKRWPADGMVIDHINSNTHDNRPSNLDEITVADNARRINQCDNNKNIKTLKGRIAQLISEGLSEREAREKALAEMSKNPRGN